MYDMLGTHQKNENTPHLLRGKRYDMLHQVCKQKTALKLMKVIPPLAAWQAI